MSTILEYKGYFGSVEHSGEDEVLHGRLESISDLVTYEGDCVKSLRAAFRQSVDDYLEFCKNENCNPSANLCQYLS